MSVKPSWCGYGPLRVCGGVAGRPIRAVEILGSGDGGLLVLYRRAAGLGGRVPVVIDLARLEVFLQRRRQFRRVVAQPAVALRQVVGQAAELVSAGADDA